MPYISDLLQSSNHVNHHTPYLEIFRGVNLEYRIIVVGWAQFDTDDAPVFSKVWEQLEEKIADVFFSDQQTIDDLRYQIASIPFVAHNARFDEGCLKAAFKVYQMERFILYQIKMS